MTCPTAERERPYCLFMRHRAEKKTVQLPNPAEKMAEFAPVQAKGDIPGRDTTRFTW